MEFSKVIPEFISAPTVESLTMQECSVVSTPKPRSPLMNWLITDGLKSNQLASPLEDDRVLMLHPTEPPAFHTPLTITCGAKQVQTCLEPTTFDPQGRTLISIHLLLAAEQVRRPTLTLAKLWVELSIL